LHTRWLLGEKRLYGIREADPNRPEHQMVQKALALTAVSLRVIRVKIVWLAATCRCNCWLSTRATA